MSFATLYSRSLNGLNAASVTVEAHISSSSMPSFTIVGLPQTVVKESKYRVYSTLVSAGIEFPKGRITINLAPAELPKSGGRFDLAIALSIVLASKQLAFTRDEPMTSFEWIGELGLGGEIRPVVGCLPALQAAQIANRQLILPSANRQEASLVKDVQARHAKHFKQVCQFVAGEELPLVTYQACQPRTQDLNLDDIIGQHQAKRALVVAAAGGHNLLLHGPPGTGKSLLASRLADLLPTLTNQEAIEVASIQSLVSDHPPGLPKRPFRAPHHSASTAALVGGGNPPQPGEISLAHHGVLFLDELPEFRRSIIDSLREPLETHQILISRAGMRLSFPCDFQLIAAMNPCPCGYHGDKERACRCRPDQVTRYQQKVSGPFLDRIDLHCPVLRIPAQQLLSGPSASETATPLNAIQQARKTQRSRQDCLNARLSLPQLKRFCKLGNAEQSLLAQSIDKLQLSPRCCHRLLRVARTLADLASAPQIRIADLQEALSFRPKLGFAQS